ncbi:hypothetical protein, partial [Acinetobacter towneri]|uniref:hypothetical protein n=1 Tax=Acinetobacter towneri TaxID=202956 RepID=UPI0034D4B7FD
MKEAMSTAKEIINNINKNLDHVINKKGFDKNVEQLKNTLDKFGDKISEKDKTNIEAFKLFMQEKFKDNTSKSNEGLKILIGKIPDIASGKISLPELPAIKQQVAIEVSANKKDSNLER